MPNTVYLLNISDKKHAGFWRRAAAVLMDAWIVFLFTWVVWAIASIILFWLRIEVSDGTRLIFVVVIGIFFYYWNRVYFQLKNAQSFGKKLLGLYVLTDEGTLMSPRTAWKKEFFYTIGFPIGSCISLFRKEKKTWHDSVTGTSVFSLEDRKYTITFYVILTIGIIHALLPIAIGLYIFNAIETQNIADSKERLEVYEKEKAVQLQSIKTRENTVLAYVNDVNARYTYPVSMDQETLWTGTKQSGLMDFWENKVVLFEYKIIDTLQPYWELISKYTGASFYPMRDSFIEKGVCDSEEGKLTKDGIFLKYEFFIRERSVGSFMITNIDCKK